MRAAFLLMSGAKSLVGKDFYVMQADEALVSPSTGWCYRPWDWADISQDAGPGAIPNPFGFKALCWLRNNLSSLQNVSWFLFCK